LWFSIAMLVYQRVQWTWTNSFDLLYPSSARWLKGYFSSKAPIFHKGFVSQLPQDPMVCHHFPIERAIWGIPEFETNPCHSAAYISPILFQCIHVYPVKSSRHQSFSRWSSFDHEIQKKDEGTAMLSKFIQPFRKRKGRAFAASKNMGWKVARLSWSSLCVWWMALDLRWSKPSVSQGYLLVCGWLVVWNMNYFFHSVENFIIPTGGLIFFRGVGEKPPVISINYP